MNSDLLQVSPLVHARNNCLHKIVQDEKPPVPPVHLFLVIRTQLVLFINLKLDFFLERVKNRSPVPPVPISSSRVNRGGFFS